MSIGPQHNGGILGATNNPTSTSAGGIWTPVQHYQAQRDGLWPVATAPLADYTISRSLRFNKTDSAALNYTPAIAGNRKTWILSTWVKSPGTFMTNDNPIFAVRPGATPYTLVTLRASNAGTAPSALLIEDNASGMVLSTAMVFRDYSAWYHIVVAVDTTQSVSTNRVKMFVNGVQVTTFAGYTTYPNQNIDTQINSTNTHYIGRDPYDTNNWYSGYLADFRFIDGYPSGIDGTSWNNAGSIINLFGETDLTTGVWKPKAYSGSYGTNGFYLPFTDNSTQNNLGVNTAQVGDELRNYTVLHLSGNPANTSGYNCFSDRSSNNHLLTASGDIPTSARSPFTDTTSGSAYFNGSSYLTIPHNSILNFDTGTFTVEAWVYPTVGNTYHTITGKWANLNQDNWLVTINNNALLFFYNGGSLTGGTVSTNVWTHVAVCRNCSNLITLYVNGIAVATTTNAFNSGYTYQLEIGSYAGGSNKFNGYISNLRIIKSQSLFTGNFTPSSSPLTSTAVGHTGTGAASSITGTVSLLTLVDKVGANNSGFIDESTNNAVITRSGNVTQGSFSPFSTSGWAMYQSDISGNYPSFTTSAGTAFQFTANFTIEGWVYPIIYSGTGDTSLWVTFDGSTYLALNYDGSGNYNIYLNSGAPTSTFSSGIVTNTWNHVAMVRSGSTITLYTNGVSRGTIQNSATLGHANPSLARIGGGVASCSRYVSNLRIIKGTALYTSNFIPSTTPLTATTDTVLLTCQDNRFVDNSANNFTVTFTGTPQVQPLSPFQPHTSVTKTYSNFFDGTNDYIQSTLPSTITGTFTIDFWWYRPASGVATIFNIGDSMSADSAEVYIGTNGTILKYYNNNNERITTSTLPTLSAWNYLAVTRDSSNVVRLYLNGTQVGGTYVQTGNLSTQLRIGCEYYNGAPAFAVGGYISNFRVSNIVRDVSSLPSAPFVSDANTLALTCQDSTFKDNSSYGSTVTVYDAPRCTEFNPLGRTFTTGVNYSATTHGSSGYFNGSSNNHLSTTAGTGSGFDFGTGEFTVEAWIYPYSVSSLQGIFGTHVGGNNWWQFRLNTTTLEMWGGDSTGTAYTGNTAIPANTWTHIAASRSGTSVYVSVNGSVVARSIGAASTFPANTNLTVGNLYSTPSNYWFNGHITGVRILKGTALYKSNFVPQLQPPQAVANTQLLLNFNNAGVVDYTGKNVLETAGTSKSITSTKKAITDATGSLYFDGTVGNVLQSASNQVLAPGTGDFTLEAWVYFNSAGVDPGIVQIGPNLPGNNTPGYTNSIGLARATTGGYSGNLYIIQNGANYVSSGILTIGTWHHTAVVRQSGVQKVYLNGVPVGSINDTNNYTGTYLFAGCNYGTNYPMNGYIQDIRYTKVARYTGTFTPPVRTFSATVRDIGHKQWVVNNLSVASGAGNDSLVDTPTPYGEDTGLGGEVRGNYCTLNPLDNNAYSTGGVAWTLSNGNLTATSNTGSLSNSQGFTQRIPRTGKYYAEFTLSNIDIGINGFLWIQVKNYLNTTIGYSAAYSGANGWGSYGYYNGSSGTGTASISNGGVIMIAVDGATGKVWMGQNGTWFNSGNPASGTGQIGTHTFQTTTDELYFSIGARTGSTAQILDINFGQRPFAYTAPSGYKALCTQNLPTPSIVKPNTAFDAVTYIGNGSTQTVSGLNFNPDLIWVKRRDGSGQDHVLQDVVRGFTSSTKLSSSSQAAENNTGGGVTDPQWGYISGTTSTGFTTTVGSGTGDQTNRTSWSYAGWIWDGGNNTVTNTTGTISSQVRSNPSAGFSIVGYTGAGGGTVGHGLNSAPQMMIVRDRNNLNDWVVYHEKVGNTTVLVLNNQNASVAANSVYWNNTSPTSSVFTTGSGSNTGQSGRPYIAYCFTSIPGYSMISSYTGNGAGSTTGQFIYTGFRPRFILIKSNSNTTEWLMMDAARNTANVVNFRLDANSTGIEITANYLDFLSNGFRLVHPSNWMNDNGYSFIYAAFAENPFKYSLAR